MGLKPQAHGDDSRCFWKYNTRLSHVNAKEPYKMPAKSRKAQAETHILPRNSPQRSEENGNIRKDVASPGRGDNHSILLKRAILFNRDRATFQKIKTGESRMRDLAQQIQAHSTQSKRCLSSPTELPPDAAALAGNLEGDVAGDTVESDRVDERDFDVPRILCVLSIRLNSDRFNRIEVAGYRRFDNKEIGIGVFAGGMIGSVGGDQRLRRITDLPLPCLQRERSAFQRLKFRLRSVPP
jgi:hypothetical protein